jgi:hypothetical protein
MSSRTVAASVAKRLRSDIKSALLLVDASGIPWGTPSRIFVIIVI